MGKLGGERVFANGSFPEQAFSLAGLSDLNKFSGDTFLSVMDPAICMEAQEAQLSQYVANARESALIAARRLARQHEIVEELERSGRPATAAKRLLATFAVTCQLDEDRYESYLRRLHRLAPALEGRVEL